jgi:hypothetical protein
MILVVCQGTESGAIIEWGTGGCGTPKPDSLTATGIHS